MKKRNGFVSNSSSSSFIVVFKQLDIMTMKREQLIPEEKVSTLLSYGFKRTNDRDPMWNEHIKGEGRDIGEYEDECYTMAVSCNQDEIIQFLVTEGIPFHATIHYDNEEMFWDGVSDILVLRNFGREYAMYGSIDSYPHKGDWLKQKAGYKIPASSYLEGGTMHHESSDRLRIE